MADAERFSEPHMKFETTPAGFTLSINGRTILQHDSTAPCIFVGRGQDRIEMHRGRFDIEDRLVERFVWLRSATAGWWQADVGAGDEVAAGDRVGAVLDPFGDLLKTITAPEPGVVLFLTTSPAVAENGLLLGLGGGMQPYQ